MIASSTAIRSDQFRPFKASSLELHKGDGVLVGRFQAMGTPCEVLFDTDDEKLGADLLKIAAEEAWRIEEKFSRYRDGNVIHKINTSHGVPVTVDDETARLLDFADQGFKLSEGLFDVTSGVLRKVWKFNAAEQAPSHEEIAKVRAYVGWEKVEWSRPHIRLQPGMEIDLGGIGKEYAVDRALELLRSHADIAVLVNFGGDIAAAGKKRDGASWKVGIESIIEEDRAIQVIQLSQGAVATSGDTKKFVTYQGRRYGHILNPQSGWPVAEAPRSVTVVAHSCTEAGFLSTLAMLNGKNARTILQDAGVQHWTY